MQTYIYKNQKKLRYGFTTGSCAAAAAKAATIMLFDCCDLKVVSLMTPKQILLQLQVKQIDRKEDCVTCAIQKDAGDDPDVTNGIFIYATVKKKKEVGIQLDGGEGVGIITRAGLEQEIGQAAINKVPRHMILTELTQICKQHHYIGGLEVCIFVPEGKQVAKQTFNRRLGIVDGISILGTTGIVEPMSEPAIIETIQMEIKVYLKNISPYLIITPGSYGEAFLKETYSKQTYISSIQCSNYIGETIDNAVSYNAKGILFIAHIGKFIKVAAGIMNTHSSYADARMEILVAHASLCGVKQNILEKIMNCVTTDEAISILKQENCFDLVIHRVIERIEYYIKNRCRGKLLIGLILFSNQYGILGETTNVPLLWEKMKEERGGFI